MYRLCRAYYIPKFNPAWQVARLKSRILLVDDHELVRDGIACLLEPRLTGKFADRPQMVKKP